MGYRRQILPFDALRAVAAALVMSSHVRDVLLQDWRPGFGPLAYLFYAATGNGHPAVTVFFVLSGFWITKAVVERQQAGTWSWGGFLLDRLTRLWMVLLPALLLGALFDFVSFRVLHFPPAGYHAQSIPADVESHLSLPIFAANAVFLQGLFAPAFGSNGPLWSLANEFWYCLWFPALHIAVTRRRVTISAVLAIVAAMLFKAFLPGFVCWLCGSLLYLLCRRFGSVKPIWGAIGWLPFAILFVADHDSGSGVRDIALGVACVLPFWQAKDWPFGKGAAIAAYGSGSSYSLYAFHFPLLALIAASVGLHQPLRPTALSIGGCFLVCACLTLAAWVFSELTERHTRRVRQWLGAQGSGVGMRLGLGRLQHEPSRGA